MTSQWSGLEASVGHPLRQLLASFDGQTDLQAGDQSLQLLLIAPLVGTDVALHSNAFRSGQGQQDAAIGLLDAEIDVVAGTKHIADLLEWTRHCLYLFEGVASNGPGKATTSFPSATFTNYRKLNAGSAIRASCLRGQFGQRLGAALERLGE